MPANNYQTNDHFYDSNINYTPFIWAYHKKVDPPTIEPTIPNKTEESPLPKKKNPPILIKIEPENPLNPKQN
jgi:hypothetical protein